MKVVSSRKISIADIVELSPSRIAIGPGPGGPDDAGCSLDVIRHFSGCLPILGVCLGHQCIAQAFGGKVIRAQRAMHGKTSRISHSNKGIFKGLPQQCQATRYHSLLVEKESLPECLEITAESEQGEIMGLRHCSLAVEGVQFHPESILTEEGLALLQNFLYTGNSL